MFGTKPASGRHRRCQSVSDDHFVSTTPNPRPMESHNDNGDVSSAAPGGRLYGSVQRGASLILGTAPLVSGTATLIDMRCCRAADTITANYLEMECRPRVRVRRRRPSPLGHDRGGRGENRGVPAIQLNVFRLTLSDSRSLKMEEYS